MRRQAYIFSALAAAGIGAIACIPAETVTQESGSPFGEIVLWPGDALNETEPNDDFAAAMPVELLDPTLITGEIQSDTDYDIYSLGPMADGTRLRATIQTMQAGEFACCFFDQDERLLARASLTDPEEPRTFDVVLPGPVNALYLLAFSPATGVTHDYAATLSPGQTQGTHEYHPQVIVLSFTGASDITVAGHYYPAIPPFDAATISPQYAGRTAAIIQRVLDEVRADYLGLDVQVYLATDPGIPAPPLSTIYFGGSNPDLLGVADGVDPYNSQLTESAIIYTDTFSLFSSLDPDEEMLAQILSNVTSHEIGHLLGLRHTEDYDDIMDVTATARRLLSDQWFKRSKLHTSVCPLGYQDGPTMLAWTVGGQLAGPDPAVRRPIIVADGPGDFSIPRSLLCSHCPG